MGREKQEIITSFFMGQIEMHNNSESIIKYFLWLGGEDADKLFTPYVWGTSGFQYFLEQILSRGIYGNDLKLLLIKFYVVGSVISDEMPSKPKLLNYSRKNKDIAVAFAVTRDKFHDVSDYERRKFIVNTTLQAIDMVESRLGKRKLDIDFETLRRDVKRAAEDYLRH